MLAAARELPAGHVITEADVRVVRVAVDPEVSVLPADRQGQVVGNTVAVPVTPGALLSNGVLGVDRVPPKGQSVVGLALKPGQYPDGLSPGSRIRIVAGRGGSGATVAVTGHSSSSPEAGGHVIGTVLAVGQLGESAELTESISVQVPADSASSVASEAAAGSVSVVQDSAGG